MWDMNSQRLGLRVAAFFFALFAIFHLVRLLKHVKVTIGTFHAPFGATWIALIVAGALSLWMWRLSTR